ncbi:MAG: TatD family hydrolase [Lentimicrobiaceae bacterium]
MQYIDTHTHVYLDEFANDRQEVISHAIAAGVTRMMLPNIDSTSINSMLALADQYPDNCLPMIGLHPTSVNSNYMDELSTIEKWITERKFYGIGECGMDLYWDHTYAKEQELVFRHQIDLARTYDLPLIVHIRKASNEVIRILKDVNKSDLRGIFHCFSGSVEQAKEAIHYGFSLGLGGVITFKNNIMQETIKSIDLKHLVLETDAPFLAPVPHRGKRNEPLYIPLIAQMIADIKDVPIEEVAEATTNNAKRIFSLD